jgi:hypothetical protein
LLPDGNDLAGEEKRAGGAGSGRARPAETGGRGAASPGAVVGTDGRMGELRRGPVMRGGELQVEEGVRGTGDRGGRSGRARRARPAGHDEQGELGAGWRSGAGRAPAASERKKLEQIVFYVTNGSGG